MSPSLAEIAAHGRMMEGFNSQRLTRSSSVSSMSGYGGSISLLKATVPEPVFIATSAASQIVTNDHDGRSEAWLDQHGIEPSGETAFVAPAALKLVNKFLDQLLFNFLAIARSTSLAALRPAVSEVLKPKLAKDAINGADQELHEYLGGGEDDELLAFHNGVDLNGEWDLELVWKRTRLRCMVYSSLGDMEEEDEDYYMEQEHLDAPAGPGNRLATNPGTVSPAVAIFLTSILEFMGEQALVIAGQAAYHRLRIRTEKEEKDGLSSPTEIAERVVVDESDMERVALDRTLGRLWRGWKKRVRSPTASMSRSFSIESLNSAVHASRSASIVPQEDGIMEDEKVATPAVPIPEDERAALIPLPMTTNDIRQIEIPGLAIYSDDEEEADEHTGVQLPPRPKSMMFFGASTPQPPTPTCSQPQSPQTPNFLRSSSRKRSNSLPSPSSSPYSSPAKTEDVDPKNDEASTNSVASVIAGAAALGLATVEGIKAAANGQAPQTVLESRDETEADVEIVEEPQIMTSARISIGGNISPDYANGLPGRSRPASIHSLRVIDVTSRSPTISRQNSADDYLSSGRLATLSRTTSLHAPIVVGAPSPRGTSPVLRTPNASPIIRNPSAMSSRQGANSVGDSISEVDETQSAQGVERQDLSQGSAPEVSSKKITTAFKLGDAPPPRSAAREKLPAESKGLHSKTLAITSTKASDSGAPPLTPLRELMEVAPDTSDEASSTAPSYETYSMSDRSLMTQQSSQREQNVPRAATVNSRNSPPRSSSKPGSEAQSKHRPPHKTGSSSSSTSHKIKPVRTSDDAGRGGQSFEELIRSDTTIQYTLTPQSVRNIEGPDSPVGSRPKYATETSGRSHAGSITKLTGLHSNPPSNHSLKSRPSTAQARDARIDRDSVGDFAEFIRSTGPPGVYKENPIRTSSAPGHRGRQASGSAQRVNPVATLPKRAESSAGRNKLQARDAVVPHGDTSSELIDFIRQGPPSTNQGDHRIPRTVAPFRSTMDSDQMVGAVGGKAIDASLPGQGYSQASTIISHEPSMQSKTSSINSQSALLNNSFRTTKQSPAGTRNDFDEEDMMPKRKTRRVRDPYAIDYSDDEEELEMAAATTSKKPQPIREESLADFLRNVPPPSNNDPPPFAPLPQKDVKRKASAPSIMARFGRHPSPAISSKPSSRGETRSTSSRSTRSGSWTPKPQAHIPIAASQQGSGSSTTYSPTPSNDSYVAQLDGARNPSAGSGRVLQKSYQPREASTYTSTHSNDLADFLRSEPPAGMNGPSAIQTRRPIQKEESGGLSRMFGRRRKVAT